MLIGERIMSSKKRSRNKKVVVVINQPVDNGFQFDKVLDQLAYVAAPTVIWAGIEIKLEIAALAFFWWLLCVSWSVRIRRNSK